MAIGGPTTLGQRHCKTGDEQDISIRNKYQEVFFPLIIINILI